MMSIMAKRKKELVALEKQHFDLIIIGGGVTGAGIALDAASRGFQVALFEKEDFASGTSSKSTKLVHGGLRYLKQFEIGLVHEVGTERAIVHRLAPHLVLPEKMVLPLVKGGSYGKSMTWVGLTVYDILAKVKGDDRKRMLNKQQTLAQEPLLNDQGLEGGAIYAEYRTDDARLTLELVKSAQRAGAQCFNYTKITGFEYVNDKISGVQVLDELSGMELSVDSRFVVSAAGPWVDKVRQLDAEVKGKRLFQSKGIHLVVDREKLPIKHSIYFDVADGRMMFAIPRNRVTYIGTTDTEFKGDLNDVRTTLEDAEYVLKGANAMFPEANLVLEDVESSWAGLRPLIFEEGKSASEMSRKDEVFFSESGLISIAGGKLTGYRKMAERVVDIVNGQYEKKYQKGFGSSKTKKLVLTGGPFANAAEVTRFVGTITGLLEQRNLPKYLGLYLVSNYGRQAEEIAQSTLEMQGSAVIDLALAEVRFALKEEEVFTALDFFNRRTGRLYFDLPSIPPVLDAVIGEMSTHLDWSGEQAAREKQSVLREMRTLTTFEPQAIYAEN